MMDMMMGNIAPRTLPDRFFSGNGSFAYGIRPVLENFLIGVPEGISAIAQASKAGLKLQRRTLAEMEKMSTAQIGFQGALAEANHTLDAIHGAVQAGFADTVDAIQTMQVALGAELEQVRWLLGQMDVKLASIDKTLADILTVLRGQLHARSQERLAQGVRAFAASDMESARECLLDARKADPTSYLVNLNFGLLSVATGDSDEACNSFHRAALYAPSHDGSRARYVALEAKARAYFCRDEAKIACEVMELALPIAPDDERTRASFKLSIYESHSGSITSGMNRLRKVALQDSHYFLLALTDQDLVPFHSEVVATLSKLCQDEAAQVRNYLNQLNREARQASASSDEETGLYAERIQNWVRAQPLPLEDVPFGTLRRLTKHLKTHAEAAIGAIRTLESANASARAASLAAESQHEDARAALRELRQVCWRWNDRKRILFYSTLGLAILGIAAAVLAGTVWLADLVFKHGDDQEIAIAYLVGSILGTFVGLWVPSKVLGGDVRPWLGSMECAYKRDTWREIIVSRFLSDEWPRKPVTSQDYEFDSFLHHAPQYKAIRGPFQHTAQACDEARRRRASARTAACDVKSLTGTLTALLEGP